MGIPKALVANQSNAAKMLGKSARWLRDSTAPRMPDGKYNLIELAKWNTDREVKSAIESFENPESESGALEELRRWKARKAELDFKRESGEFKHIDQVRSAFAIIIGPIGNALKTIQKQFGDDALEILQEALDQSDAIFNRSIDAS